VLGHGPWPLADKLPGWTGLLGEVLRSSELEGLRLVLRYLLEASESIGQVDLARAASREELSRWAERVLLAESLEEVLL